MFIRPTIVPSWCFTNCISNKKIGKVGSNIYRLLDLFFWEFSFWQTQMCDIFLCGNSLKSSPKSSNYIEYYLIPGQFIYIFDMSMWSFWIDKIIQSWTLNLRNWRKEKKINPQERERDQENNVFKIKVCDFFLIS